MIRIKDIVLVFFILFFASPIIAQNFEANWLNKKILKLENSSDNDNVSSEVKKNSTITSIDPDDLIEGRLTLPYYYWSWSKLEDLILIIDAIKPKPSSAALELIISALTSEMPANLGLEIEAKLYTIRLKKLLEFGQYKEAQTFIKNNDPNLLHSFEQQFVLNILNGNDTLACSQYKIKNSDILTAKRKIYCLYYDGKQSEAKIVFETAKILNKITEFDISILDILFETKSTNNPLEIDLHKQLSALDYVILQKKKFQIDSGKIPKPYLYYNLSQTLDAQQKIKLSETLAGLGIINHERLFNTYKENNIVSDPTLSKRKNCIIELELAISNQDSNFIQQQLRKCLSFFEKIGLAQQYSKNYRIVVFSEVEKGWETPASVKMRLLSGDYSQLKNDLTKSSNFNSAQSIARNDFTKMSSLSSSESIIINAFRNPDYNLQNANLIEQGKIGEVIISSIIMLQSENMKEIQAGLTGLIQTGLIDTAKEIAIKILLES